MPLPLRIIHGGAGGHITVTLTKAGLGLSGKTGERLDLLVNLWDALVNAIALEEIDLRPLVKVHGAARRVAEARAALQVRISGRKHGGKIVP